MEKLQSTKDKKQEGISEKMLRSLPIITCGGSGGHIDFAKGRKGKDKLVIQNPFVSYVEKENVSEEEKALLESFLANISELESKIIQMLGNDVVKIEVGSESYGKSRPMEHTIRFHIKKDVPAIEDAQLIFGTIQGELDNYLESIIHRSRS